MLPNVVVVAIVVVYKDTHNNKLSRGTRWRATHTHTQLVVAESPEVGNKLRPSSSLDALVITPPPSTVSVCVLKVSLC